MTFTPDKITKQQILDAVKKIESENIALEPSTKFDVIINGKPYPPKEIMRYAHELMNGEHIWLLSGGEPTNKYLIALGFEIKKKSYSSSLTITGNMWKLGCNWGKGAPSFYKFIKQESIVIGEDNQKYKVGDLILVCEGHTVNAIARVNETPISVTTNDELEKPFDELRIDYEDKINYADAEWYELGEAEELYYKLQQGIVRVNPNHEVYEQALQLWNDRNVNYWIFQGNPNAFDFETAIRNNLLEEWTVSAHKDKIKVSDKVILWISGKSSGCYALAEITSEPKISYSSKDSHLWKTEDTNPLKAGIKITHNLIDNPILLEEIKRNKELDDLKIGNQGTNFTALKKEYKKILQLAINKNIPIEAKVIYAYLVKSLSHRKIEQTIFNIKSPARGGGFVSMKMLRDFEIIDEKKGILLRIPIDSEISSANGKYLEALNLLKRYYPELSSNNQAKKMSTTKNIILYGPPGTGKTYNSIDKAVEIAALEGYTPGKHAENKTIFDELRKDGQIEFVTFHQNYSYEDFIVGIRPNVEEGTNSLSFKKHYGVFYQIANRAKENYFSSMEKKGKLISVQELVNDLLERLRGGEKINLKTPTNVPFSLEYLTEQSIQLIYNNESRNNTLSVNTLIDITEDKRDYPSSLRSYFYPLKDYLLSKRIDAKKEKEELKNFILVIDEINRANISKVFGELITLLEDDKRLGEENELKITLPNGEKEFGVPPNLFIIGTMNTADKSIALIDIALRRRFEFVGFYPEYEELNEEESTLLRKINEAVFKEKKSADFLIGHAYFMKGQMIQTILQNKVVPLLMEYFSGKADTVSKIFADTNWNVTYNTTNFIWDISPR